MNIILYYSPDERSKLNKLTNLVRKASIVGNFRSSVSVTNPVVVLEAYRTPAIMTRILESNYVYIEDLKRYYFITDITIMTNNIISLSLKADVLTTYKDSIMNLQGIIERNENTFDVNLNDSELPIKEGREIYYIELSTSSVFKESDPLHATDNLCLTTIQGV